MQFLKDNRAKAFTLDIETDSTVIIDERSEKESRAEFMAVLTPMLQQVGQMVTNTPESAKVAGELLKWTLAPYRAGRGLDGAIDELSELMEQEQDKPKGDDPVTAQNKTALQIEQMKTDAVKARDQTDAQLKQAEMAMRDQHEKMKVASNEKIKLAELQSRQGDARAKAQQDNIKLIHSREEHQQDMIAEATKQQHDAQVASMKIAALHAKQQADAQRANDQRAAAQFKAMQPPRGGPL